ncbi:MAG: hypothetical protein M1815_004831 [Lichina confinis]|nr:MAG: hypothetical protein M1815_004831 [Lichina confinis]
MVSLTCSFIRASFVSKVVVAGVLLGSGLAGAKPSLRPGLYRRENPSTCDPILGRIGSGSGGRKIGIVIDASYSMTDNDPDEVRLDAAKGLANTLVSPGEATDDKPADLLTVVDFANEDSARVRYELGDPAGATAAIERIFPRGGTFIGGGVQVAIDELAKDGTTGNRTGIVILSDGEDDPPELVPETVAEIERAGQLGIRVSFGFLQVLPEGTDVSSGLVVNQDPGIQNAVLQTGGSMATINTASNFAAFLAQILSTGLTSDDASSGQGSLFSGLTTTAQLSETGSNSFEYDARAGESLNVTVRTVENGTSLVLKATLRDLGSDTDIATAETDDTGLAVLSYTASADTASADTALEVAVTAADPNAKGLFSVGLESSEVLDSECLNSTATADATATNGTAKPTGGPASPFPTLFTGGAGSFQDGAYQLAAVVSFVFGTMAVAMIM